MIVFLTLCYCGLLWLLLRLKVLKPTLGVKLSPIGFMLVMLLVLFIPMLYAAPSGMFVVYGEVVQIAARVAGRVVEAPVQPNTDIKKGDVLFKIDPEPYQAEVDRLEALLAAAEQAVPQLKASVDQAEAALKKSKAQLDLAKIEYEKTSSLVQADALRKVQIDKATATLKSAEAAVANADAALEKGRLAYESEIGGVNTTVAQRKAELARARIDLKETTVYAPTDGFVTYQALKPGFVVGRTAFATVMSIIPRARVPVAAISQNYLRYVEPGQTAELSARLYPGRILNAKVASVVKATGQGQHTPSGQMPANIGQPSTDMFPVRLELDKESEQFPLHVGAGGTVAIYTNKGQLTHVIRKVMMRMDAWLNFLR